MRLLVAGLSRTGTTSIHQAAQYLGLQSLHHDLRRLNGALDGSLDSFRVYDDVDVVGDIPSALFHEALCSAYPDATVVLTIRDEDSWWVSVEGYLMAKAEQDASPGRRRPATLLSRRRRRQAQKVELQREWRRFAYGSAEPRERLWREAYRRHNDDVLRRTPPERLLIMDVTRGDGWPTLCRALGLPEPEVPFPHANRAR